MPCAEKKLQYVDFKIPETYKGKEVNMFRSSDDEADHFIKISCKNPNADCRDQSFEVEVMYTSVVQSQIDGTDELRKTAKEFINKLDAFRVDVFLREIKVIESDSSGSKNLIRNQLSITKDPLIFSANTGSDANLKTLLGTIWVHEDDLVDNILIFREKWIEHIAFIGGLNIFYLLVFYCLFKCCVSNQFNASLLNEVNPDVVSQADERLLNNPFSMCRRKLMSGTILAQQSTEEMILDQELAQHLSLKNLFETSKLV